MHEQSITACTDNTWRGIVLCYLLYRHDMRILTNANALQECVSKYSYVALRTWPCAQTVRQVSTVQVPGVTRRGHVRVCEVCL